MAGKSLARSAAAAAGMDTAARQCTVLDCGARGDACDHGGAAARGAGALVDRRMAHDAGTGNRRRAGEDIEHIFASACLERVAFTLIQLQCSEVYEAQGAGLDNLLELSIFAGFD